MLFTDPTRGHRHGYFDGWGVDRFYYYAGEGQVGDQEMTRGNKAVLNHVKDGRKLFIWETVSRSVVACLGEFVIDKKRPFYTTDAPDSAGDIRSVIMFRLRSVTAAPSHGPTISHTPVPQDIVADVATEQQNTERMAINPSSEPREAERREASLAANYERYLSEMGHTITRKKIIPAGEQRPLFTDLFDVTDNVLVEAKGSVTREAVRMALGQLFDYRRFIVPNPSLAMLLPTRPRPDLLTLCSSVSIAVVWPHESGFRSEP
ncbi:restriction endonuclease [Streptomyces sp. CBMA29]|uniref:restriction endonuclease n=1 Tax=Streptomyces sp. CBMA29 TaxID=1896314 RepID=UPI001CB7528C|nr:restriction endonuclease [Streptomyces sp. CBMA29]